MKYGALISSSVRQWRVRQRVEGRKFFEEGVFRDNLEYEKVFFIWIEKGSIILGKSTACTKEPSGWGDRTKGKYFEFCFPNLKNGDNNT